MNDEITSELDQATEQEFNSMIELYNGLESKPEERYKSIFDDEDIAQDLA